MPFKFLKNIILLHLLSSFVLNIFQPPISSAFLCLFCFPPNWSQENSLDLYVSENIISKKHHYESIISKKSLMGKIIDFKVRLWDSISWRRKWQPTPVFLPGESQGWRSLVGCRLGVAQSDTTEAT